MPILNILSNEKMVCIVSNAEKSYTGSVRQTLWAYISESSADY